MYVFADGVVLEAPAQIESDRVVAAFILGTGSQPTDQSVISHRQATCEVVAAGELAAAAMRCRKGDRILVAGALIAHPAQISNLDDPESQWVRLELHAEAIGHVK
jgi:hypothetical protein